jgi:hypothetical protein
VPRDRRRRIRLDARPHGVVLLGPLAKALVLAGAGGVLLALGWPASAFTVVARARAGRMAPVAYKQQRRPPLWRV